MLEKIYYSFITAYAFIALTKFEKYSCLFDFLISAYEVMCLPIGPFGNDWEKDKQLVRKVK